MAFPPQCPHPACYGPETLRRGFCRMRRMAGTHYNRDLAVANILFGANFSFYVSLTGGGMDFRIVFLCQLLAGAAAFIPAAAVTRGFYRVTARDAAVMAGVSLLIVYGWLYMLLWGASLTSPIDASTIATLGPAFTLITAILLHRRRVMWADVGGIILAIAGGAVLIFDRGAVFVRGSEGYGNLIVLGAVVATAVNTVLVKPQLARLGVRAVLGWCYLFGTLAALPLILRYATAGTAAALRSAPLGLRTELLYIMIFGTVLPIYLLYRGTGGLTSVHTALYRYIQPVVATALALARRQERIDHANIVAAAMIAAAIVFTMIGFSHAKRMHQQKKL